MISYPPFFSVIMPTFNQANFLRKSVASVLNQSFANFELLVIDNHSNDGTGELLGQIDDHRLISKSVHNNGVIAKSRNMGIELATGKFVCFLDSDDFWYPEKLEKVYELLCKKRGIDVVCHSENVVDETGTILRRLNVNHFDKNLYKSMLIWGNRCSTSATTVRRSLLDRANLRFNEDPAYNTVEDYALWLDVAKSGGVFTGINEILGEYLIHNENNSNRVDAHIEAARSLLKDHIFNKQNFTKRRVLLWKFVKLQYGLRRALQHSRNGNIWRSVISCLHTPFDVLCKR